MKRKVVIEIISGLLAALFVYAAASKLIDYNTFRLQLSQSPLISDYANFIFWLVPSLELITAILLALSNVRLYGLYGSLFLLTLFTTYLVAILLFSHYIPCSCGGVLGFLSWKQHIVFNIAFLLLSVAGIRVAGDTGQIIRKNIFNDTF